MSALPNNIPRMSDPDKCLCATDDEVPCEACQVAYLAWLTAQTPPEKREVS